MKRKAEKQQGTAPVSAFAARKARLQQTKTVVTAENSTHPELTAEPPTKRPRRSLEQPLSQSVPEDDAQRATKQGPVKVTQAVVVKGIRTARPTKLDDAAAIEESEDRSSFNEESEEEDAVEGNAGMMVVPGTEAGYESPADTPGVAMEFPLSKIRLNKSNIVYSDERTLCVRIWEKMSIVLIGRYDLWVKRGVVSVMGAKLHPSPRVYRVYAPSTHSLPVIKCVSGVDGAAEVEFRSCHSGIYRLRDLSPLYQRVWSSANTPADKYSLKQMENATKRTFSVLYTSADDPLKRHLRPLHLEKQWSAAIKNLSQRTGRLQVLVCGPKGSGKSTFGRYLLNHLLSPAPQAESNFHNTDGVAFLDLDLGQPEFSPMGQVYLAHLRSPVFGPPFTHPSLNGGHDGDIIRAHHIGATSPKEDPDHYVLAATNLMEHYRDLFARFPQCPLIINYPGWIFGLGLEVATYLVRSLGLSDVVYMSEKGPMEVVEPLRQATGAARIPLTILPSQPTEFASRSSAQLRSMQMQSYFHMIQPKEISQPVWLDRPIFRNRPFHVRYAGPNQGIHGIMVLGSQISPDLLSDSLEGTVVGVVAVESPNALPSPHADPENEPNDSDINIDITNNPSEDEPTTRTTTTPPSPLTTLTSLTTPTKENLPYLPPTPGTGTATPLHPSSSSSLGLALIRTINKTTQTIELATPIPASRLRESLERGHPIVLVRGGLDNPNWAISEEYYAARAAERRFRRWRSLGTRMGNTPGEGGEGGGGTGDSESQEKEKDRERKRRLARLKERVRRAKDVPFMTVIEDHGRRRQDEAERERRGALWKLRKKAVVEEESEVGY
ncbi:putative RNA processing protein Grc3 [Aspergillus lucknowensis]|uniref:Polynucleotide 5'-hydroxyl-kinase GRC3 n=1 Tax=Aspergillus lucknowensis TaxID=176173 RepID=A0ABR4LVP1_9EURO